MERQKSPPESYERSRTVSLTCSGLAFLASITSQAKLDQLEPFGLKLGDLNKGFVVTALIVMAAVSLASFLLSFFNDAADNYRSRRHAVTKAISDIDMSQIEQFTQTLGNALEKTQAFAGSLDHVRLATGITPQIRRDVMDQIFRDVWPFAGAISAGAWIDAICDIVEKQGCPTDRLHDTIASLNEYFATQQGIVRGRFEEVTDRLYHAGSEDGDLLWSPDHLSHSLLQMSDELMLVSSRIEAARLDLKAYRTSLIAGRARLTVQVIVLGVGVPAVVFALALAHALGAWIDVGLPALPDLFA